MATINKKPLLPLRDIVIFPSIVVPLFVGREKSIKALQEVMKTDKSIVLVAQKNPEVIVLPFWSPFSAISDFINKILKF